MAKKTRKRKVKEGEIPKKFVKDTTQEEQEEKVPYKKKFAKGEVTVFFDSPDAGDDDCLCSLCGQEIEVAEVPVRIWPEGKDGEIKEEIRLHQVCAIELGVLQTR